MTPGKAIGLALELGVERRAIEMFMEDSEGLSLPLVWENLDESFRGAYRAAAAKELEKPCEPR